MKRINSLQILRALGFILIFAYHNLLIDGMFSRLGVSLFFVLSGFLNIIHDYDKDYGHGVKESITYAVRKIRKIFVLHVVSVLFAFLLYIYSFRSTLVLDPERNVFICAARLFTNITLISDWIPRVGIWGRIADEYNIVTWFISALFLFYIITPGLLFAMHRIYKNRLSYRAFMKVCIFIIVFAVVENVICIYIHGSVMNAVYGIYHNPLFRVVDYLFGAQFGYLYVALGENIRIEVKNKVVPILIIVSAWIALLTIYGINRIGTEKEILVSNALYYSIPISVLVFVVSVFEQEKQATIAMGIMEKTFVWLGNISQRAFLIHVPVINLVHAVYRRIGNVNVYIWFIISFFVTLLLTCLHDKVALKRKNK